MKLANIALVSFTVLGLAVMGCKKDDDTTEDSSTLGTSEAQLIEDDSEATDTDDDLEAGLDEPLSGATADEPGTPGDGAEDALLEKVRTNAGVFFKPAGCLTSTRAGNKLTHVFDKCSGPYGMAEFTGTVSSTWAVEAGKVTVTHEVSGFKANGANITGSRVVVYSRTGSVITKTRTGNWSGQTGKGKELSHTANFVTTYDASTRCLTRDGSAQTTIGGRSFERTVDNYKRCGIGRGGCPESGTITLSRTKSGETLSLTIAFSGGPRYQVTRPSGRQVERVLVCRSNA